MSENAKLSQVLNPVVFISLGSGADFWPTLSATLDEYVQGVRYIPVPDDFDDATIKAQVGQVWREFLQEATDHSNVIRINYLLCADDSGMVFPALKRTVEKYFHSLYPAGVMTDIYYILDDANILDDSGNRRNIMQMLKEEQAERVYLLSNLTSTNTFISETSIATTIALLTLFKDCVPELYVTGADASRYNEFFFLENCATRHGYFLTAGSLILTMPIDALKALLVTELLAFGQENWIEQPESMDGILPEPPEVARRPVPPMDYLCGLAIPDVKRDDKPTRKMWISRLFGQRLDKLPRDASNDTSHATAQTATHVAVNFGESDGIDNLAINDPSSHEGVDPSGVAFCGHNLYDLLRYAEAGGVYEKKITETIVNIEDDLRKAEEQFDRWLDEMPNLTKGSYEPTKRRLSPLVNQDLWPYELASDYLMHQAELEHFRERIQAMEQQRLVVKNFYQKLQGFLGKVQAAAAPYEEQALGLNNAFSAFSSNADSYFRQNFKEYASQHQGELADLSKEMTGYLLRGEISQYIARVDSFVDSHVMPSFNKSVVDILHELSVIGEGNAAALGDWALQNRQYNIRLKIGYTSLYTEANLFMPALSNPTVAANVKRHYERRGQGRMNLFAKKDANRVAVLYHAGSYDLEDLYYGYENEPES